MSKRVLILNGDSYHAAFDMFKRHGWEPTRNVTEANLICFLGGTDIGTWIYDEEQGPYTQSPDTKRDAYEISIHDLAVERGIPCVGICRGGQLLNVLNGGKMIQHLGYCVSGDQESVYYDTDFITLRVDHHQGMECDDDGTAETKSMRLAWNEGLDSNYVPDYIIWYPETKSLCFQPHPEWGHKPTEDLFFQLIKEYIECVD